jgi:hypothetical protein
MSIYYVLFYVLVLQYNNIPHDDRRYLMVVDLIRLLEEYERENSWIQEWGIAEEDRAGLTAQRWKPGEFGRKCNYTKLSLGN